MPQTKSRSRKDQVFRVTNAISQLLRQFEPLLSETGTPRALSVYLLLKAGEWDQLVSLDIDPLNYTDPRSFALDYQVTKVFSKVSNIPTSFDRNARALEKWFQAEAKCKLVNSRLSSIRNGEETPPPRLAAILHQATKKASDILGYCDLDYIIDKGRWGPGATSSVTGNDTSSEVKFRARADVSPKCLSFALLLRKAIPSWQPKDYHLVNYNKLLFVPKNAKIDRPICVEPHLNTFLQLGAGALIRKRLLRCGIDLNNGQQVHRRLALQGSLDGSYATIDLSSASDTISSGLVFDLLPESWFTLLDELRSPMTRLPSGELLTLEKFSSMGNGFTFELETLIFYCILSALNDLEHHCSEIFVYGDDIIVNESLATSFLEVIDWFGFSPNKEKTYLSGPFRESCGCDAFLGYDVRPFFLKELPDDQPRLYRLANGIRKAAARIHFIECGHAFSDPVRPDYIPRTRQFGSLLEILPAPPPPQLICSKAYKGWWDEVVRTLPENRRYFLPFGFSEDSGLFSDPFEISGEVSYLASSSIKRRIHSQSISFMSHVLYSIRIEAYHRESITDKVTLRNRVVYVKKRKRLAFANFSFGGWS